MPPLKYQPLADFLAAQPPETTMVTLTLPEIEALVGQELPLTAHHNLFWRNDVARSTSRVWLAAGWRVTPARVRQAPSAVTFARVLLNNSAPTGG